MSAGMRMFPGGFAGEVYRSISACVMSVVQGRGCVLIDRQRCALAPNDAFIVPSWRWNAFEAAEDMVIFTFSDEELRRHLGFWRDERAAQRS